jgi:hypothetical protein
MEEIGMVAKFQLFLLHLPFIERFELGIVLQAAIVDQEFHALEERGSYGRRLFSKQDVDGFWGRHAQLAGAASVAATAFGVFAVNKAV